MDRTRCAYCGLLNFATERLCRRCGSPLAGVGSGRDLSGGAAGATPPRTDGQTWPGASGREQASPVVGPPEQQVWPASPTYGSAPPYGAPGIPYAQPPALPPGLDGYAARAVRDAQTNARRALWAGLVGLVCCCGLLGIYALVQGQGARRVLTRYDVEEGQTDASIAMLLGGVEILLGLLFLATRLGSP